MNPNIFREYDIRGRVPEELNRETAYRLGQCFGAYYVSSGAKRISLGRDCRLSSPELCTGVIEGLMDAGIHVVEVGMVPTPLLYFSLHHLDVDGGVQITGSHNPPEATILLSTTGSKSALGRPRSTARRSRNSEGSERAGRFRKERGALKARR
ncbi:MAG: Phosphomannomutase [Deltaproteobacteria bacterium]|nr:Phosphomannomutase [Deltaproteobacteria bacterium]